MTSVLEAKPKCESQPALAKAESDGVTAPSPASAAPEMSQAMFMEGRDRLVKAMDASEAIVHDLREFNQGQWVLRYPGHADAPAHAPLSVLRLDLKLGAVPSAGVLVDSLEKSSVGQLLDGRMTRSMQHLKSLRVRITDTQSKVLVTGDLNAGKSTLINALLRRDLVPTDQQPCTSVFCEIHDAVKENHGVEEVHVVRSVDTYTPSDDATFDRRPLSDLNAIFAAEEDAERAEVPVLKVFCRDLDATKESLLHNGAVDIALIDAPGLNQDSVKTTALFAREEEIDVVVFVVSAENHFTLSGCEFLQNASNEKAYVFVVVNKYDQLRNKDKCRRRVLEQLRELSPKTYEEADELVHFVDARTVCELRDAAEAAEPRARFESLERSLHDFVLRRRAKSKLMPAQTYMERLLSDVQFLVHVNQLAAKDDLAAARRELSQSRPALAACEANAAKAQRVVEGEEDTVVSRVAQSTEDRVAAALDAIRSGASAHSSVALPPYPGLWNVWQYAQDVRVALLASLQAAVTECETEARDATAAAVAQIAAAGEELLPKDAEVPRRQFVPSAMFARKPGSSALAGLGVNAELVAVRLTDLFDAPYHMTVMMRSHAKKDHSESQALVPSVTMGLGALSLLGSQALNLKALTDLVVRVTDLLATPAVRRWVGPALLLAGAGALAWVVLDLPRTVPRNIGRHLHEDLVAGRGVVQVSGHSAALLRHSSNVFATMHSMRTTREVRKVLRLASWDLQEKFRVAVSQRRADVARAEAQEKLASSAITWLTQTAARSVAAQQQVAAALDAVPV